MTLYDFLGSEFFWGTVVGTWGVQLVGTLIARKRPKNVWFWRVVRALHGLFDRIDPPAPEFLTTLPKGKTRSRLALEAARAKAGLAK